MTINTKAADRIKASILAGALGDALGAPVEFLNHQQIVDTHGTVEEFVESRYVSKGSITDDTQMVLYTMEALIRNKLYNYTTLKSQTKQVHISYLRWLQTQGYKLRNSNFNIGFLEEQSFLKFNRAAGHTCLHALKVTAKLGEINLGRFAQNDSKGCGGIMRSAPFGYVPGLSDDEVYKSAAHAAALTHGHITGQVASGAFALIINQIVYKNKNVKSAVEYVINFLASKNRSTETVEALNKALAAAEEGTHVDILERLGGGWVAEEALAIGVYSALAYSDVEDFNKALTFAVTHSGDSDSTGSIAGNILGALHGTKALNVEQILELEGADVINKIASDFIATQNEKLIDARQYPKVFASWTPTFF